MQKFLYISLMLFIFFAHLQAQTTISDGVIDGDTWIKENSPYLITTDLLVHNLVIESGVEVLFSDNWQMTVDGSLIAHGTYSDSIIFRPAPTNTQKWNGILFDNSSYASVMRYCRVDGTNNYALSVDGCLPEISYCRLINNTVGGFLVKNTTLSVSNFFIRANGTAGIWLEKADLSIFNSIISQNVTAIYLSNKNDILTASNCVLVNGTTGIRVPINGQMSIKNSIIYNNVTQLDVNPEDVSVSYCCVEDGFPGLGNITADPLFLDQTTYKLQILSPCRDGGNPAVNDEDRYFPPSLGSRRNDMGAYGGPLAYGWFPPLYIIPQTLGFGRVTLDSSKSVQISIKNYRGTGITISDILPDSLDNGYFEAEPAEFYLPFEDSTKIRISFQPDSEQTYTSTLEFETSTEGRVALPVNGQGVLPHLSVPADSISFGPLAVGDSSKFQLPITNLGGDTLKISFEMYPQSAFSVRPQSLTVDPDSSTVNVDVSFAPVSAGVYMDSIMLNSNDRSKTRFRILLSGTGLLPMIYTDTDSLEFGEVDLFSSVLRHTQVSNLGNTELNILAISIIQPDSTTTGIFSIDSTLIFPIELEQSASLSLPVRYRALRRGKMTGQLTILSSDPIQDSIHIVLNGTGTAPQISCDSLALDFGTIDIGRDSTQFLQLRNTGNAKLSISAISLTETESDKSKRDPGLSFYLETVLSYPLELQSDSTLTLAIRFAPDRRGLFGARLSILSSDPETSSLGVLLSGTGIDPEFNITVSDMDFGLVPIGRDSLQYLHLRNNGKSPLNLSEINFTNTPDDTGHIQADQVFFIDSTLSFPLTIQPYVPVPIPIRFSPLWRGKTGVMLNFLFSGPVMDSLQASLTGTGIAPRLTHNISSINFGPVEIGKTSDKSFQIYNSGNADLWISEWQFISVTSETTGFRLADSSFTAPHFIPPDSSLTANIRFAPQRENDEEAVLVIKSNDPFNRQDSLKLLGSGFTAYQPPQLSLSQHEIDFGTVFVGEESSRKVTVLNIGSDQLIVYHDSLRISGLSGEDYSLAAINQDILLSAGDSANLQIYFRPSSSGDKKALLRLVSNDPVAPDTVIRLDGSADMINPAVISLDTIQTSHPFIYNQPAVLAVRIDSISTIDSALVYLRRAGRTAFTPFTLQRPTSGSVWQTSIAAMNVSVRGLEYYIRVHYGPHTTVFPAQGEQHPDIIQVFIPQINFPQTTREETYQMISVPFLSGDQTLEDLFYDDLGNYDRHRYRIYGCNDGATYNELEKLDQTLPPGQALWIISKESKNLDVENVLSAPSDQPYIMTLKKGWNMIATPFAFPVDWQMVSSELALRYFDGTDWPFVSVLEPFKGYAVKAEEETTIYIPATETDIEKTSGIPVGIPVRDSWYIQIQGFSGAGQDIYNFAGANTLSDNGIDRFDYPDPPPIGNYLNLALCIPDREGLYSSDFRARGNEGYRFEIILNSNLRQSKNIRFTPYNLPDKFDWTVVSEETQVNYGKNDILTEKQTVAYILLVGTNGYIEQAVQDFLISPKSFRISQNYPNPFNPLTKIKFQIPMAQNITVIIYDLLGREIKYLRHDSYMEAGYHELSWDGTDKADQKVSSGIYFLYFNSPDFKKTLKMVLQR